MQYKRKLPGDRSPMERIMDWNEFHFKLPEAEQKLLDNYYASN